MLKYNKYTYFMLYIGIFIKLYYNYNIIIYNIKLFVVFGFKRTLFIKLYCIVKCYETHQIIIFTRKK